MPKCTFCNSEFYDKCNLNTHQKRSKYCLKIQLEKEPNKIIERDIFECNFCKKVLTTKYSLKSHINICKVKKSQTENSSILEKVEKLSKEVSQLKDKPIINITNNSITNNNYTSLLDYHNNYGPITEKFEKHYNIEDFLKADQKKIADMTLQYFLSGTGQPMYYITDRSRNKFIYTDKENNEKEDPNAILLRRLVYRGLKPIIDKLYKQEFKNLNDNLARYIRKDLGSDIIRTRTELKELEESHQKTDILKEGDDYVLQLTKCLPSSIKDRIFHDSIGFDMDEDLESNADLHIELEKASRIICGYTANELRDYKKIYKETGKLQCPIDIREHPDIETYKSFIKE
jgi:hypothetical protein